MAGEFGMLQSFLEKLAVADEHLRPSFDQSFQLFASVSEEPNDPVDPDQGRCRNHPSNHGVVPPVHGVLNGVREEAKAGQRTTLDVLIDQQALVTARLNLVTAQRDRVVGSYNLLSAVGRLSPQTLGLPTSTYEPMVHYQQVRDAWMGVRTPDGK